MNEPDFAQAEALERATDKLDQAIAEIARLIGPNAAAARVAGRLARAAAQALRERP